MNERFYYTTDGTTVIGPVTRTEFHQQVGYDNEINTIQVCPKGSDQWLTFLEYSRAQSRTTALAKRKVDPQAANGCAGCLALIAVLLLWIGVTAAFTTTYKKTEFTEEIVVNPKTRHRDITVELKPVVKEKQVEKTGGETARDILIGVLCVGAAIALLIGAAKVFRSAHTNARVR